MGPAEEGYGYLASICKGQNLKLYYVRPKVHFTLHLAIGMSSGPRAINPLCPVGYVYRDLFVFSQAYKGACVVCMELASMDPNPGYAVWSDEDYIGRIARLARTVHPLTQSLRTLQKALGCYRAQFDRLKRLHRW